MSMLLAVDAGGTSTRALVLDSEGIIHGYGRAGGGNPTARGIAAAVSAVAEAATIAAGDLDLGPGASVTLAMAGQQTAEFAEQVAARLHRLGWSQVGLQHDLLGVFGSGTWELAGYALIAGTGSVAARISGGELVHVIGGRGWLLGDAGSGYWIGHRVARAVIAALDGQAATTALTSLVLEHVGIRPPGIGAGERLAALRQLMSVLYAQPPVQLAALAPLPFAVAADPVAREILVGASKELAELVAAVQVPDSPGPVVVGGSVVVQGLLAAPPEVRRHLEPIGGGASLIPVSDGVLGAAVLALRSAGAVVDQDTFARLRADIEGARQQEPRSQRGTPQ